MKKKVKRELSNITFEQLADLLLKKKIVKSKKSAMYNAQIMREIASDTDGIEYKLTDFAPIGTIKAFGIKL